MAKRKFTIADHEVDEGNGPTKFSFTIDTEKDIEQPAADTGEYDIWQVLQDMVVGSGFNMSIEEVPAS